MNGENAEDVTVEQVRLPHTCKVTPFHYFDESIYRMVCGYRRRLDLSDRGDRRAFICFGAAAHYAKVYLDGELIAESPVLLRAGMGGVYVRTKGKEGNATLTLTADGCESVTLDFTVTQQ